MDLDNAITVRLKKGNEHFEILVNDIEKAMQCKHGKLPIAEVLMTNDIYKDIKKGELASEHEITKLFKTSDIRKAAEAILKEGEIRITAEYKQKLRDEKRKAIVNLIHRNSIDTKTNKPHPLQRIENALEEAKVNIDYYKKPEEQVKEIVKQISHILPIKFETREISLRIPAQFAGKSFSIIKRYSQILRETWQSDGSLLVVIDIPAGMQAQLFDELNHLTHGHVESEVIKVK